MAETDAHDGSSACLRTRCGRQIFVGRLLIGGAREPLGRVVMRINCTRAEYDQLWASLTPAEARLLAGYLLSQAAAVELPGGVRRGTPRPAPAGARVRVSRVRVSRVRLR